MVVSRPASAARWSAVSPPGFWLSADTPPSRRASIASSCPPIAARWIALFPSALTASLSAPPFSTILTTSECISVRSSWANFAAAIRIGVRPALFLALTSAPSSTRLCATSLHPMSAAMWRAVFPESVFASMSAPFLRSTLVAASASPATPIHLIPAALCSGVHPSFVFASILAPLSHSNWMHACAPSCAASWRGVSPSFSVLGSAPKSSSIRTIASLPVLDARCRRVKPSLSTASGSAPASRSIFATTACEAHCCCLERATMLNSGVNPLLFLAVTSAPLSRIPRATPSLPICAARCKGVSPSLFVSFVFAPPSKSAKTASMRPISAATCREVHPSLFLASGSAPLARSSLVTARLPATCPIRAAM
mmetsp:Transcript_2847/g.6749  ORF Transcript_2847/g.6749 Transcript_2847/m.6749 type:complete len:367 (+) Transcript_2847:572-1672(+)